MPDTFRHIFFRLFFIFLPALPAFAQQDTSHEGALFTERGKASYYHNKFNGRRTTSGEIYKKNKLTAAHKTLPFGTQVKVTNVNTNKSVIVTINDRGPRSRKRIIDVSFKAARILGMLHGNGIVEVTVEQIPPLLPPNQFRKNETQ